MTDGRDVAVQSFRVESFLNYVWMAISATTIAAWIIGRYSPTRRRLGEWCLQGVALGALLLILLPVVSLTDDLQAWTAPAEAEHGLWRADSTPETLFSAVVPPLWSHIVLTSLLPASGASDSSRTLDLGEPQMGVSHPLENRPPPASATS